VGNGYEGFVPNDVHARSTYDSFFGLANGDASTGTGLIGLSVTPDVQAWVNAGESNYGWVMPGWPARTDGTAFSSSKAPNPSSRPLLRVMWLPAGTPSASFRQNVDGYSGVVDTRVRAESPDAEASTAVSVFVDWTGSTDHVLIRFDDILGTGPGQIPPSAEIHAAMLDLASMVGNAMGDGGHFHAMLQPWEAGATWNSMVNGLSADGIEAAATASFVAGNASLDPNVQAAFLSFEVTTDLQSWANGTRPNYGWTGLPWANGGDGWGFGTSEQGEERNRPRLRVYYSPRTTVSAPVLQAPGWSSGSVVIRFTGQPGTAYTLQRSGTLSGAWNPLGTALTDAYGQATYTDSAPLSDGAFYRAVYP
jgi:hypothetical protein